jgi:hypothetical protein
MWGLPSAAKHKVPLDIARDRLSTAHPDCFAIQTLRWDDKAGNMKPK